MNYLALLDRYHEMIDKENWWDGRLEKLVYSMNPVWARLNERQRKEAVEYMWQKYLERINK